MVEEKDNKKSDTIKADDKIEETDYTEFEYLKAKVDVLQEEIRIIQDILKQNNLVHLIEETADTDLEDATWKKLEDDENV